VLRLYVISFLVIYVLETSLARGLTVFGFLHPVDIQNDSLSLKTTLTLMKRR